MRFPPRSPRTFAGYLLLGLAPLVGLPGPALAAGAIAGTITLDGAPPKLPPLPVAKDASVCGSEQTPQACEVAKGGGLKNVVVALASATPAGKLSPTSGARIDQKGCRYEPHVLSVNKGTALDVLNSDAVLHNVHANLGKVTVFNVAMPIKGEKRPFKLTRPGVIKLQCDAGHSWMSAFVHVFEHPFHAVTDAGGTFKIEGVPAGTHKVQLWHEGLDPAQPGVIKEVTVEVKDGATATLDAKMAVR